MTEYPSNFEFIRAYDGDSVDKFTAVLSRSYIFSYFDINYTSIICEPNTYYNPLEYALMRVKPNILKYLLQQKKQMINFDTKEKLVIMFFDLKIKNLEICDLILTIYDGNVNQYSEVYSSFLHISVKNNRLDVLKMLIKHKDLDTNFYYNDTVEENFSFEVMDGMNAISYYVYKHFYENTINNNILKLLVDNGCEIHADVITYAHQLTSLE